MLSCRKKSFGDNCVLVSGKDESRKGVDWCRVLFIDEARVSGNYRSDVARLSEARWVFNLLRGNLLRLEPRGLASSASRCQIVITRRISKQKLDSLINYRLSDVDNRVCDEWKKKTVEIFEAKFPPSCESIIHTSPGEIVFNVSACLFNPIHRPMLSTSSRWSSATEM